MSSSLSDQEPEYLGSDITEGEFGTWRTNPTTLRMMQYFRDFRESIAKGYAHSLLHGEAPNQEQALAAAKVCVAMTDLIELEFADIAGFYNLTLQKGQDDGEHIGISATGLPGTGEAAA